MDIARLRTSFQLVVDREPFVLERFYEVLFERHPQAQPLFGRNSRKAQAQMLTQALVSVLDKIEDADWLSETLGAMGAKHVGYGVADAIDDWVDRAARGPLPEVRAAGWTPGSSAGRTAALTFAGGSKMPRGSLPVSSS